MNVEEGAGRAGRETNAGVPGHRGVGSSHGRNDVEIVPRRQDVEGGLLTHGTVREAPRGDRRLQPITSPNPCLGPS